MERAGRLTAVFFAGAGLLKLLQTRSADYSPESPAVVETSALVAVAIGLLAWALPWRRLPWAATFVGPVLALALIGIALPYGESAPGRSVTATLFFVLVFVWVAIVHSPKTVLAFAPLAALAHAGPYVPDWAAVRSAVTTGVLVVPVATVVGWVLARRVGQLDQAQGLAERRLRALEMLAGAPHAVLAEPHQRGAAERVGHFALEVLGGEAAVVLTGSGDEDLVLAGYVGAVTGDVLTGLSGDPELAAAASTGEIRALERSGASWLAVPLRGRLGPVGAVVVAADHAAAFAALHPEVIDLFARQVAVPLEERLARERLSRRANRDPLTNVGNRRHADELLASVEAGDAVALIDIDEFKAINDSQGHAAGDEVLIALAEYLRGSTRHPDAVARFGGEEFLVVLRGVAGRAERVAERLVAGWRALRTTPTFSVGVAEHDPARDPDETVALADAALYEAKASGRNTARVVPRADELAGSGDGGRLWSREGEAQS